MFTDMVGYSALTQKNEALALDLLEEHRKIVRPFFEKHDGREIETAGDSFFVEFNSAVEATKCAIEIQTVLHQRNQTQPADKKILLRIGLHIGDVVYMDKHVHGDGVNIAARLEPLAAPGGICISEDVARQIRNKVDYPIVQLPKEKLKNISMPMDIYFVALPWVSTPHRPKKTLRTKPVIIYAVLLLAVLLAAIFVFYYKPDLSNDSSYSKFSLAVLPLANISENPEDNEYFADGMTEELISSLSKISGLNVIARTSIMRYKESVKDVSQISKELMVGTVLAGSVRKAKDKARISLQLIDASTQKNIWSRDYNEDLKDIFATQSKIAQNVANELKVSLISSEKEQLEKSYTNNMQAYQDYLQGKHHLNKRTPESIQTALIYFEKSIQLDSSFALPYANAAYCYALIGGAGYGNISRTVAETKAKSAVMKALSLDPTLAEAHAALGYIKFRIDWDWQGAETAFKNAISMKPGYATAHEWYALFLAIRSGLDESLKEMKLAYQLDPLSNNVNNGLARIHYFRGEYDQSLLQSNKTIALDSNYAEAHFTAGMTLYRMKNYEQAVLSLKKAIELSGGRPVILGMLGVVYARQGKIDEAKKLLAALELPPVTNDKLYAAATIKTNIGQIDEAFSIFEKLIEEKYGIMVYLKVEQDFFPEIGPARYRRLLQKMRLE